MSLRRERLATVALLLFGCVARGPVGNYLQMSQIVSKCRISKKKRLGSDSDTPTVRAREGLAFEFAGDEHGIVRRAAGGLALRLGERIELVPSHCDTTVNLYDAFVVHRSGKPEAVWPIVGRGKSQ